MKKKVFSTLYDEFLIDRSGWSTAHITTPRESCIEALRRRETLREMLPGETATIAGVEVRRLNSFHLRCCYRIDGRALPFDAALARIEGTCVMEGQAA
jgi:hypothetical protein